MLLGAGLGAGVFTTYRQYKNGNLQKTIKRMRSDAQNQLEDMM
jgi:hypothetical protein